MKSLTRRRCALLAALSVAGLAAAFVGPRMPMAHSCTAAARARSRCVAVMKGSTFDELGMPKIRPRGQKDAKQAEEVAPVTEAPPVRAVPELVLLNAFGLLIEPTDEMGLFMREVLLKKFEYTVRLPRPDMFTASFMAAYEQRRREFPNFGAAAGLSSEEWWAPIFYKAFLDMGLPKEDIDEVFVETFEELYYEALVGDWAWEPVDDVLPMLDKLQEWRLEGGPKLGVVTDFDERLSTILDNLDMAHYFDVVVSTKEAGASKPDPSVFQVAMERVGVRDPSKVMHFGQDFDRDVVGAAKAGLQPFWVAVPAQDRLEPEQEALKVSYTKVGDLEGLLDMYGRSDPDRLVTTTWKNKNRPKELFVQY